MYNRSVDWQWGKNFLFSTWITAPENDRKRATFQTLTLLTPDPRNDPRKHVDYCP